MKNKIALFTICLLLTAIKANSQWTVVCNTGNGFVDNFENFNDELYATGFFTTLCGTSCNYVAKYDGSTWRAVGNGFPNAGHHLEVIDSVLYGVAYQPKIDSNWLYKFDGANFRPMGEGVYLTTAVMGFSQTANLYNVTKYKGTIVVTGEFNRVGSKHISGIMRWNGTQWDSLGSGISGHNTLSTYPDPIMYPHDVCEFGADLIVGGSFEYAGGQVARSIARWDGTQWHPMGSGFNGAVYGVCVYNGELYAGGDFTLSGTTPLKYIAKWNGTSWIDPGFHLYYHNPADYSFVHTLKVISGRLIISGGFDRAAFGADVMHSSGVTSYNGISLDTLRGGIVGQEAEALAIYKGLLFAGGGYNNIHSYVASYDLTTAVPEINRPPVTLSVYPNPAKGQFTIWQSEDNSEITVTDLFGQQIIKMQVAQKITNLQLDNSGIYLVCVKTKQGTTTRKLIVTR